MLAKVKFFLLIISTIAFAEPRESSLGSTKAMPREPRALSKSLENAEDIKIEPDMEPTFLWKVINKRQAGGSGEATMMVGTFQALMRPMKTPT